MQAAPTTLPHETVARGPLPSPLRVGARAKRTRWRIGVTSPGVQRKGAGRNLMWMWMTTMMTSLRTNGCDEARPQKMMMHHEAKLAEGDEEVAEKHKHSSKVVVIIRIPAIISRGE